MELGDPVRICPMKGEHVTWRSLEGESVLLHLETGVYFTLDETGTAAWELFDGATSLAAIGEAPCTHDSTSCRNRLGKIFSS